MFSPEDTKEFPVHVGDHWQKIFNDWYTARYRDARNHPAVFFFQQLPFNVEVRVYTHSKFQQPNVSTLVKQVAAAATKTFPAEGAQNLFGGGGHPHRSGCQWPKTWSKESLLQVFSEENLASDPSLKVQNLAALEHVLKEAKLEEDKFVLQGGALVAL